MKKFLVMMILGISAATASAGGLRSVDLKANLRSDFGLGVGITAELPMNFEFAPSLNYYFDDENVLTINADFRYRFDLPRNFSIYPVVGLVYFHCNPDWHDGINKIGLNIGAGFAYDINSHWAIGAELKYQYVDDWDDAYFNLGVSYKF